MPAAQFTLAEAAAWLSPPITARLLGCLVRELGIERTGVRRVPHQEGRPPDVYDMEVLIGLHAVLVPWLRQREGNPRVTSAQTDPPRPPSRPG